MPTTPSQAAAASINSIASSIAKNSISPQILANCLTTILNSCYADLDVTDTIEEINTQLEEMAGGALRVIAFDGMESFVSSVLPQSLTVAPSAVRWLTRPEVFGATASGTGDGSVSVSSQYYSNWPGRAAYCDDNGKPFPGCVYLDKTTKRLYIWREGEFIPFYVPEKGVTQTAPGLMSAADKKVLDTLAEARPKIIGVDTIFNPSEPLTTNYATGTRALRASNGPNDSIRYNLIRFDGTGWVSVPDLAGSDGYLPNDVLVVCQGVVYVRRPGWREASNESGVLQPLFDRNSVYLAILDVLSTAIADTEEISGKYEDGVWRLGLTEAAKRQAVIDEWMARCVRECGVGSTATLGGYDAATGEFYLGDHEVTYTFEQVQKMLIVTPATIGVPNGELSGFRTHMAPVYIGSISTIGLNYGLRYGKMSAVALAGYYVRLFVSQAISAFAHCTNLRLIVGEIVLEATAPSQTAGMFTACPALESVKITQLATDLSFGDSPKLSLASLQHLVANAANTAVITVTVHPTVYEKLSDETNTEWHTVLTDALAKNISIASA